METNTAIAWITSLAIFCGVMILRALWLEMKAKRLAKELEQQKHIISIPASSLVSARKLVQFADLKDSNVNLTIGQLERMGYTYRREYDKGDILCFVKTEQKEGVGTLTKTDAALMKAKNAVIIDGHPYEFIKDSEQGECDRCALKEQCDEYADQFDHGCETLCRAIFKDVSNHRFKDLNPET